MAPGFLPRLGTAVLDLLWPPECPACGAGAGDLLLCLACRDRFGRLLGGESAFTPAPDLLEAILAPYRYEPPLRDLVLALKYERATWVAPALGALLAEEAARLLAGRLVDAVVPVPLSRRRRRERGFNQAQLLAAPVAAALDVPLRPRILARRLHRPPQASLDGAARRRNVQGVFAASAAYGRAVLVVDDVATTGATLADAAAALRAAGARRVVALCLCRSLG